MTIHPPRRPCALAAACVADRHSIRPLRRRTFAAVLLATVLLLSTAHAADWPQWGGRSERNFVSGETGLPTTFRPDTTRADDSKTTRTADAPPVKVPALNLKWSAALGSQAYVTPAVAGGRVFAGANGALVNRDDPRFERLTVTGVLFCFDEATGQTLWRLDVPRLRTENSKYNADNLNLGICSSPTVDGNRVYFMSPRGEILCLDVEGLANGNDGPFEDEGHYIADSRKVPDKPGRFDPANLPALPTPAELRATDADIVWRYEFVRELDVWPHDAMDCSILPVGDYLYVCTCNGRDSTHRVVPSPNVPDIVVLDKKTGALLAASDKPVGKAVYHGNWSSPTLAHAGGRDLIVWGGGDGFCYAYDAAFAPGEDGKPGVLRQVWSFDCNPPEHKWKNGKLIPYADDGGPSEIIATPVCVGDRVYVAVGQDSRHGADVGSLCCIDATMSGDVTTSACLWRNPEVDRTMSSIAVSEGLLFVADHTGNLRCIDAETGKTLWRHDLKGYVFASPLVADGKVYIGTVPGKMTVAAASREKKILWETKFDSGIYASPVAANGVLYVTTQKRLYAFQTAPDPTAAPAAATGQ